MGRTRRGMRLVGYAPWARPRPRSPRSVTRIPTGARAVVAGVVLGGGGRGGAGGDGAGALSGCEDGLGLDADVVGGGDGGVRGSRRRREREEVNAEFDHADECHVSLLEATWWERRRARRRAGFRARKKYRQMRKSWLRRKRKLWVWLVIGLVSFWILFSAGAVVALPERPVLAAWLSGLVGGAAVALFVVTRETPPTSVERWLDGALGEQATAKQLQKLPDDWEVLHDLGNGDFNFDHVAVGPPGVFLLNSKFSSFRLETGAGGSLLAVHVDDPSVTMRTSTFISQAKRDAVTLKHRIETLSGKRVWVEPVIVWWGQFPEGGRSVDGVGVVAGDKLAERLLAYSKKRPTDRAAVVEVLRPGRHALAKV